MQQLSDILDIDNKYHIPETINHANNALEIMIKNGYNIISFDHQINFYKNNISILEIDKDTQKYIYKFEIPRMYDVITDFKSNLPIKFDFGGNILSSNDMQIIPFLAQYQQILIYFYIDPNENISTFYLKMKCYFLDTNIRKNLFTKTILTNTHKYQGGISFKI